MKTVVGLLMCRKVLNSTQC